MKTIKFIFKWIFRIAVIIVIVGFIIPQNMKMPVQNATTKDFNENSFWAYPWGSSITQKGIDIFADKGTKLNSSTFGIVLITGTQAKGGKYVLTLGPKWRIHYYAHLNSIECRSGQLVFTNSQIGSVGDSGNAKSKPPHLHYSIVTLFPYPWKIDKSIQGWKKMFYLNPAPYLI